MIKKYSQPFEIFNSRLSTFNSVELSARTSKVARHLAVLGKR